MNKKNYRFTKRGNHPIQVMFNNDGHWLSTGCHTLREAEVWAKLKLSGFRKDITLSEYANGFFSEVDSRNYRKRMKMRGFNYSRTYYQRKDGLLRLWILPLHGFLKLTDITPRMIEDLIFDIPRSNETRNKVLTTYREVLQSAKDDLIIATNPAKEIRPMANSNKPREIFSHDELSTLFPEDDEKLIEVWGELWWAAYFCILKDTGWRPGEAAALRAENILVEKSAIFTAESVDAHDRVVKNRIKTTGKGFDYKIGFLSPQSLRILCKLEPNNNGYIFCKKKFICPDVANKHLRGVLARVNIPFRSQYSFRHTFDSTLYGRIPDGIRRDLMGHSAGQDYGYVHVSAIDAIDRTRAMLNGDITIL